MGFHYFAGAAFRALTAHKDGPSLYDVCDPLLLKYSGGDSHLGQFYRTALGNPALRPLLRRTGLPALKDETRLAELRAAILRARDEEAPDWAAIGAPVAALMDGIDVRHPRPAPSPAPARPPGPAEIDKAIRSCAACWRSPSGTVRSSLLRRVGGRRDRPRWKWRGVRTGRNWAWASWPT